MGKVVYSESCGGMGFRDLRSFNLALLAKQGWRLQQQSNSLFYQVFKSKYFPDTSFVQAQQGRNPSYVWQSILAAQPIFKHGMRWQVGNGENIYIWKDKWIPNPSTYQIISPRTLLPEDATVNVLIDADHGTWRSLYRVATLLLGCPQVFSLLNVSLGVFLNDIKVQSKEGNIHINSINR